MLSRPFAVLAMFVVYAALYVCRTSLSAVVSSAPQLSTARVAAMASAFAMAYSAGKLVGGALGDTQKARYLLAASLVGCGGSLLLFAHFFSAPLPVLLGLWAGNGVMQALAWPAIARVLNSFWKKEEKAFVWGVVSSSQNLGAALGPLAITFLLHHWGADSWSYVLKALALATLALAVVPVVLLQGYDAPVERAEKNTRKHSTPQQGYWGLLVSDIFLNGRLLLVFLISVCMNTYMSTVSGHLISITKEFTGAEATVGAALVSAFQMGGLGGSLAAGLASDRFFAGDRKPVMGMLLLVLSGVSALPFSLAAATLRGICVYGSTVMVGVLVGESVDDRVSSSAVGVLGALAAIGKAAAGTPAQLLIERFEAAGLHFLLLGCAVVATGAFALLWTLGARKRAANTKKSD